MCRNSSSLFFNKAFLLGIDGINARARAGGVAGFLGATAWATAVTFSMFGVTVVAFGGVLYSFGCFFFPP